MGKNSDRKELIQLIVSAVVHKIVAKHTNRPESEHFLLMEATEYFGQARKIASEHTWNYADKDYIKEKSLRKIISGMESKYPDVLFSEQETKEILEEVMLIL